jgi:hypothetical protein
MLKLFQEMGRDIKEKGRGGKFKYDIFDTLLEPEKIPQYTPTQHHNKEKNTVNVV